MNTPAHTSAADDTPRPFARVRHFYAHTPAPTGRRLSDFAARHRIEITLFFVFFIVHTLATLGMRYPILTDEYVTMAEGVFLWGDAPHFATTYQGSNYYGYGYSVLYGWLYYFTQDMELIFRLSLVLNSFFLSFIPVLAYHAGHSYFSLSRPASAVLGVLSGLYPAVVVYGKYALNETMLFLLPVLAALLLLRLYTRPPRPLQQCVLSAVLGFLSMYAYTVHGRGAALLATVFFCLLFLAVKHRKQKGWLLPLCFLLAAGLWFLADRSIKGYLNTHFFQAQSGTTGNTLSRVLSVNMAGAFSLKNIGGMLRGFLGQSLYMMAATFGLLALFIGALITLIRSAVREENAGNRRLLFLFVFVLVFALLSLLISVTFLSGNYSTDLVKRTEYYIYGRYNEASCLLIVMTTLLYLLLRKKTYTPAKWVAGGLFALVMLLGSWVVAPRMQAAGGFVSYSMVPSVPPFMGPAAVENAGPRHFVLLCAIIGLVFVLFSLLTYKNKHRVAMALLGGLFVYSSVFSLTSFVWAGSQWRQTQASGYSTFSQDIAGLSQQYPRVYASSSSLRTVAQFAFSGFEIHFLDQETYGYTELADIPENSLIIHCDQPLEQLFTDVYAVDVGEDFQVWVYGDELRAELDALGYSSHNQPTQIDYRYLAHHMGAGGNAQHIDIPSTVDDSIIQHLVLQPGGFQFGPYATVYPGRWQFSISGSDIGRTGSRITHSLGIVSADDYTITQQDSHTLTYTFQVDGYANTVEFITENLSDHPITLYEITLSYLGTDHPLPLRQAADYPYLSRNLDVYSSPMYRGNQFTFNPACIKGQTGLLMREGGEMELSGLSFQPGEHQLWVYGKDLQEVDVHFLASGTYEISDVAELADGLAFTLQVHQPISDGVLRITNPTAQPAVYQGVFLDTLQTERSNPDALLWQRAQ